MYSIRFAKYSKRCGSIYTYTVEINVVWRSVPKLQQRVHSVTTHMGYRQKQFFFLWEFNPICLTRQVDKTQEILIVQKFEKFRF